MKDRHAPRTKEKNEILLKDNEQSFNCQLVDISSTGISVTTDRFIPTYKEIEVVIEISGKEVAMKGSVRWSIDPGTSRDKKGKLGIFVMAPPPEFLEYVKMQENK